MPLRPLIALLAFAALACRPADEQRAAARTDSAYSAVQERGRAVMGVNQYTSAHVFEDLPDDFQRGDFTKPFQVHAQQVPGTAVMAERRAAISYAVTDRPRGAEVDIRTTDSAAVAAVHAFLAFQRRDHHAAGHEMH